MNGLLLDTNVWTTWLLGDLPDAPDDDDRVYISVISLGELAWGLKHGKGCPKKADELKKFIADDRFLKLGIDQAVAHVYGEIRADIVELHGGFKKNAKKRAEYLEDPVGSVRFGIDENDLWLMAQAVERGLTLVSSDRMQRVRDAVDRLGYSLAYKRWLPKDANASSNHNSEH